MSIRSFSGSSNLFLTTSVIHSATFPNSAVAGCWFHLLTAPVVNLVWGNFCQVASIVRHWYLFLVR